MDRDRADLRGHCCNRSRVIDRFNLPSTVLKIDIHRTIRAISQREWDSCFPGDPEGWGYYRAVEESELAAFSWFYFAARERDRIVAVVPAFITDYRVDTAVQGGWRTALQPLLHRLRRPLTRRLVCFGSPLADKCHLGFAPLLPADRRREVVGHLLASVDAFAAKHGIGLVAAKDIADADLSHGVDTMFAGSGFIRQPSLPNAALTLPHGGENAYLKMLSHAARRDVRRKLKSRDLVKIERRYGREALHLVPDIVRLYEGQRNRSLLDFGQFETLTPAYFRQVLMRQGQAAVVSLYLHHGRLLGFNLCYHTDRLFIDKFIGFKPPLSRALNLYVVSWMDNVNFCLARGIPQLQSGQTGYAMKLHLGAKLQPNWMFFRHRNLILNTALRLAGPLLAADRYDDDLARMVVKRP